GRGEHHPGHPGYDRGHRHRRCGTSDDRQPGREVDRLIPWAPIPIMKTQIHFQKERIEPKTGLKDPVSYCILLRVQHESRLPSTCRAQERREAKAPMAATK